MEPVWIFGGVVVSVLGVIMAAFLLLIAPL